MNKCKVRVVVIEAETTAARLSDQSIISWKWLVAGFATSLAAGLVLALLL
jgi:hypothetical protein